MNTFRSFLVIVTYIVITACSTTTKKEPVEVASEKPQTAQEVTTAITEPSLPEEKTSHLESNDEKVEIVVTIREPIPPKPEDSIVYFDYNTHLLTQDASETIRLHVDFIKNNPDFSITLEGHADARGTEQYNQKLGIERAEAIRSVLVSEGISKDKINVRSLGETQPAVSGDNDLAWQSNRRAIFVYSKSSEVASNNEVDNHNEQKLLASD